MSEEASAQALSEYERRLLLNCSCGGSQPNWHSERCQKRSALIERLVTSLVETQAALTASEEKLRDFESQLARFGGYVKVVD